MHHSSEHDEQMTKRLLDAVAHKKIDAAAFRVEAMERREQLKLGATGEFPEGKLTDSDEGEIKLAVGASQGKVVIDFGTQVTWIGFTPKQARELAESIRKQSYAAEKAVS